MLVMPAYSGVSRQSTQRTFHQSSAEESTIFATHFRYQVRTAITWRIVSELVRRHEAECRLAVVEMHPGGGTYDCISLWRPEGEDSPYGRHLCDFNQDSQHLHIFDPYEEPRRELADLRWPDENDYVHAYLRADEPIALIDSIEAVLGLPAARSILPPISPSALRYLVLAELAARFMLSNETLQIRWGFLDTSGGPDGVREDLWRAPALAAQRDAGKAAGRRYYGTDVAFRYWLVGLGDPAPSESTGIFTFAIGDDAKLHRMGSAEVLDLWRHFKTNRRSISHIVNLVLKELRH
jgi:hypothetical protein